MILKERGDEANADVGFVLGDGFGGVDLDDCRDPKTGVLDPRAEAVIDLCEGAYVEVSPSGEGVKIFGRGKGWEEIKFSTKPVRELWRPIGYFTVTGDVYRAGEIVDLPLDRIKEFYTERRHQPSTTKQQPLPQIIPSGSQHIALVSEAGRQRNLGKNEDEMFEVLKVFCEERCPDTDGKKPWTDKDIREIAHSAMKFVRAYPITESGDAEFFAARFAANIRFDHLSGEWLRFDGLRWARQEGGEVEVLAKEAIRARRPSDLDAAPNGKEIAKWALGGESARRRANLLTLAKNEVPLATNSTKFDNDTRYLGAPNGLVDLETGKVRRMRPEDHIKKLLGAPWDLDAKSSRFDDVLAHALPDEEVRKFLQQLAGLTLGGVAEENVLPIIYGVTRSSKGTILDALASALGDYAKTADMSTFASARDPSVGPRPDILNFVGARMVAVYEAGRAFALDTAFIKTLSGSDKIIARGMRTNFMTEFRPKFLVWFATDKRPRVPTDDDAYFARLCEIPFNVHIPEKLRDTELRKTLSSNIEDLSAILAWAYEGLRSYRKAGRLIRPAAVREAIEGARAEMNPVTTYLDEVLVFNPRADVTAGELRSDYEKWCRENGMRAVAGKILGAALRARGGRSVKKIRGERGWVGVGLLDPSQGKLAV